MYHKSVLIHGDSLDVFANLFVLKTASANSQVAMETVFFFVFFLSAPLNASMSELVKSS